MRVWEQVYHWCSLWMFATLHSCMYNELVRESDIQDTALQEHGLASKVEAELEVPWRKG